MAVTTLTLKGQVVIPASLRKKMKIHQGTRLKVEEKNGKIIMEPLPDDLVSSGRGLLKSKGRVLQALLQDRADEGQR
ncbi:spoVT / AbrB like domain protein [bacterium BMS3Bbin14]|nr:spoVT / AbrB like domain protein [bacterium BMS3Abin13]GBE53591.1 spoVT / AbrB like domain protein [bacterium BMS3Bbin14]